MIPLPFTEPSLRVSDLASTQVTTWTAATDDVDLKLSSPQGDLVIGNTEDTFFRVASPWTDYTFRVYAFDAVGHSTVMPLSVINKP